MASNRTWQLSDSSPDPILLVERNGTVVSINPALGELFGCAPEQVAGKTLREITRNTERELSGLFTAWDRRRSFLPANLIFCMDGETRIERQVEVELFASSTGDMPDCVALRLLATAVLPAAMQAAEAALCTECEWRNGILAGIAEGVIGINQFGQVVFLNRAATEVTGWSEAAAIGQPIHRVLPEANRSRDGKRSWLSRRTAVPAHGGPIGGELIFLRDVTAEVKAAEERRRCEDELQQAREELRQLAYSASHDLQEPLRMIAVYSQLLGRKLGPAVDEEIGEYLTYTLEGARRMESLVRDLLAYAEAASEFPEEPFEPAESSSALETAVANLQQGVTENGAQVAAVGELPTVWVRWDHLLLLFQNLIGNSLKYRSPEPPRVTVSAVSHGDEWEFAVADNGMGIPPQYHAHIFGIFKRLHRHGVFLGTGIGLAICRRIVDHYHGRIRVESEEGRGATFYFTVPAYPGERAEK
jgi:signal transduction histidine kinase